MESARSKSASASDKTMHLHIKGKSILKSNFLDGHYICLNTGVEKPACCPAQLNENQSFSRSGNTLDIVNSCIVGTAEKIYEA